jgi:hypothetical protein
MRLPLDPLVHRGGEDRRPGPSPAPDRLAADALRLFGVSRDHGAPAGAVVAVDAFRYLLQPDDRIAAGVLDLLPLEVAKDAMAWRSRLTDPRVLRAVITAARTFLDRPGEVVAGQGALTMKRAADDAQRSPPPAVCHLVNVGDEPQTVPSGLAAEHEPRFTTVRPVEAGEPPRSAVSRAMATAAAAALAAAAFERRRRSFRPG